jgi:hypothetical protein
VQWFAWSVSSPPSFQIANTSGGTPQAGFALVDLAMLFPPSDAQTLFSAIQNNRLTLSQRTMLLGAVIGSVGYLTGNGWMTQMWNDIKARQVYQVCVPGTHDAGTAVTTTYATTFSNTCNTQTQSLTVYQQLMAGARYLDLRPCWWAGSPLYAAQGFYLTHYTEKLGTYWGALGQTLQSALNDIQQFLQSCGSSEIVSSNSRISRNSVNSIR